jgi:steroid delta-isomerase-like uncharacterized protein
MPPRPELETISKRWISLWCAPADWTLFDRLHAENFEDASSAGRSPDKQGFAEGLESLIRAFPDLKTKVEDLVVDEGAGRVAIRWSARGTNHEAYLGVGPTGRETTITGIEIIEVRRGQLVRRWGEWDITDHTNRR